MSFAINMLALLLVLGMCWFAMVWLGGRSHGFGEQGFGEHGNEENDSDGTSHVGEDDLHYVALPVTEPDADAPCVACEGVGATHDTGRLLPCPECHGTGLFTS